MVRKTQKTSQKYQTMKNTHDLNPWFPVPSRYLRALVRRIQEIAEQAALEQVGLELMVLLFGFGPENVG